VVPRPEEKASSMKQADLRDMSENASKSVCTVVSVLSLNTFTRTPSTSSAMKTPESTKNDPEPANGYIQMEYSTD
jgi:hypothetical protein